MLVIALYVFPTLLWAYNSISTSYTVVYNMSNDHKSDAISAEMLLKAFTNEGAFRTLRGIHSLSKTPLDWKNSSPAYMYISIFLGIWVHYGCKLHIKHKWCSSEKVIYSIIAKLTAMKKTPFVFPSQYSTCSFYIYSSCKTHEIVILTL